jgi:hypothetical protein
MKAPSNKYSSCELAISTSIPSSPWSETREEEAMKKEDGEGGEGEGGVRYNSENDLNIKMLV